MVFFQSGSRKSQPRTAPNNQADAIGEPLEWCLYWYIIEKQASVIVVGGTASGKTTCINTLAMFIKSNAKIVSIEDTAPVPPRVLARVTNNLNG